MKIEATTNFKHGKMSFEEGLSYSVRDDVATYFKAQKWAKDAAPDAKCFTVGDHLLGADAEPAQRSGDTLEIQDAKMTLNTEVK